MFGKNRKNGVYRSTRSLLLHSGFPLLAGQGIIVGLFFLVFTPLVTTAFQFALGVTGFRYVTLDNLGSFLRSPLNLGLLLLLFLLLTLFLLFEVYFLVAWFSQGARLEKPRVLRLIGASACKAVIGIVKGNYRLIGSLWVTLVVYNLPVLFFSIRKIRFLRFMADEVPGRVLWITAACLAVVLLVLMLLRKSFVFQYYIIGKSSCAQAVRSGKDFRSHRLLRTGLYFFGWNVVITLLLLLVYIVTVAVAMLIVSLTFDSNVAIAAFIAINEEMEGYLVLVMFLISTVCNFALGTQLFYRYQLVPEGQYGEESREVPMGKRLSFRRTLAAVLVVLAVADLYLLVDVLRNGSVLSAVSLSSIQVTSHRGFSEDVPENTLPAIEKAIEEQADFVELDVRVTRDGELVLLHDGSLKRTTGVNKNIWDVDYADIASLDAGSWLSPTFDWVRIPTLREVFEACKGRVYLNLELKYRSQEEGLEEKVVSLIKEYDMQWQCVVTSSSMKCLTAVKELDPDILTGYIAYQLQPGLLNNKSVDFYSMKSSLITRSVVQRIHESGRLLCVWTVNSRQELQRMNRLGVDNIITDNPAYAREILYENGSGQYLVTLFEIILE